MVDSSENSSRSSEARVNEVVEMLRSRGMRMTPQRRAIVAEVMRADGHISPPVVARRIQDEMPGVDTSTIYRTLNMLEEVGVLQHSHMENGLEYHRTEDAAHVHLTCSECGEDSSLSFHELDEFRRLLREQRGFEADFSHFAITGLCRACAAAHDSE